MATTCFSSLSFLGTWLCSFTCFMILCLIFSEPPLVFYFSCPFSRCFSPMPKFWLLLLSIFHLFSPSPAGRQMGACCLALRMLWRGLVPIPLWEQAVPVIFHANRRRMLWSSKWHLPETALFSWHSKKPSKKSMEKFDIGLIGWIWALLFSSQLLLSCAWSLQVFWVMHWKRNVEEELACPFPVSAWSSQNTKSSFSQEIIHVHSVYVELEL